MPILIAYATTSDIDGLAALLAKLFTIEHDFTINVIAPLALLVFAAGYH